MFFNTKTIIFKSKDLIISITFVPKFKIAISTLQKMNFIND